MNTPDTARWDAWIDAMEPVLGLSVPTEYRPGVRLNLSIAARFAELVEAFPLPDETDPAPVFSAGAP